MGIIYEYMANRSLDEHLSGNRCLLSHSGSLILVGSILKLTFPWSVVFKSSIRGNINKSLTDIGAYFYRKKL